MLQYLELSHFALLDRIVFKPGPALNILTGETGAGKSLLLDALGAVTGSRTTKDVIRSGYDQARVEAVFDFVPEAFPRDLLEALFSEEERTQEDAVIILSREINRNGRSLCRINGRIVPQARLREVGSCLLDIHGQHESQRIFQPSTHLDILDRYGMDQLTGPKTVYAKAYAKVRDLREKMKAYGGSEQERARQFDLLSYQLDEINGLKPRPNEDELLQKKRMQVGGAERLEIALTKVLSVLGQDEGADSSIGEAISALRAVEAYNDTLPNLLTRLEAAQDELADVRSRLDQIQDNLDYRPELLEKIDARLDKLFRLKKKYGETIEEVLAYADQISEEVSHLQAAEEEMARLSTEQAAALIELEEAGLLLRKARIEVKKKLSAAIGRELAELGMKHARFDSQFIALPVTQAKSNGLDQVEFLFSANLGEDLKPLARIASGGEAARIMLAIKLILSQAAPLQLLIFDEVDSGVSGETAALVGLKLMELARSSQVMCVTHTAQVAAMADTHFFLQKDVEDNKTVTSVVQLDPDQHLTAVATLLSGATDHDTALKLAAALTVQAQEQRAKLDRQVVAKSEPSTLV